MRNEIWNGKKKASYSLEWLSVHAHTHAHPHTHMYLTLLMHLSLMCNNCCWASCMCRRFWRMSPLPNMAFCKEKVKPCISKYSMTTHTHKQGRTSTHTQACTHTYTNTHTPTHTNAHTQVDAVVTWWAFPSVRSAAVSGGLRNGKFMRRPYFPEKQKKTDFQPWAAIVNYGMLWQGQSEMSISMLYLDVIRIYRWKCWLPERKVEYFYEYNLLNADCFRVSDIRALSSNQVSPCDLHIVVVLWKTR